MCVNLLKSTEFYHAAGIGTAIGVLAKSAAGLDIAVAMPPTVSQFGLYRPSNTRFLLDFNFDHTPNVKPPYGATGDVPVVGRFTSGGRYGIAVFRNGFSYVDNNRDGVVDATYVLGAAGEGLAGAAQDDGVELIEGLGRGVTQVDDRAAADHGWKEQGRGRGDYAEQGVKAASVTPSCHA